MISIITPAWGHEDITQNLVDGIAMTEKVDFELIVCDNGGDFIPTKNYPWLKVLKPGKNLGFGGGNNFGVKEAKGDIFVFINNDVIILDPLWLFDLLSDFKRTELLGAELVTDNSYTSVQGQYHSYVNGYLMVMDKKLYQKVGGFDTGFGKGWFEDVWFAIMAERAGYTLRGKKVAILHAGSKTILDGRLNTQGMMLHAGYHYRDNVIKSSYPRNKMRIVFYVGKNYSFSDGSFEGKGVGGSESSLILLTRELAKQGHRVEVYADPDKIGTQNGVEYHSVSEFRATDYCDVFICFRNPIMLPEYVNAMVKIFWSTDQYTIGDFNVDVFPKYDKVICISPYHLKYFKKNYVMENGKSMYIDLGVNTSDYQFADADKKIPGKLLFCSVPHRGLKHLAKLFPRIKEQVPNAELFITSDYRLWGQGEPLNAEFIQQFAEVEGVKFLGMVSREELVYHQNTSELLVYPCEYDENFCVSAAECLAAGTIPITSDIGSLKTTLGGKGILIEGKPGSQEYDDEFVRQTVRLLQNQEERSKLSQQAKEYALKRFNWETIAKVWEELLFSIRDWNMIDLLPRLMPFKTEELSVLDLGCGKMESGISSQISHIEFKDYFGVDVWEPALSVSGKRDMVTKDVAFEKRDLLEFTNHEVKANGKFDIIFLFDVVEHFKKEDGLKLLENVKKIAGKRILIFMPIGDHTLEANEGITKVEGNPFQQHLSEWTENEWRELGFDIEVLRGFHHSGTLDAAWIIKDTDYMQKCNECNEEFNSSYFLNRHKYNHGIGDQVIQMASDIIPAMPDVILILTKAVDASINEYNWFGKKVIQVPYAYVADLKRILVTAYGSGIIEKEELAEKT